MARNVARNSAQRPGSHAVRLVRPLIGAEVPVWIHTGHRMTFGRAEATRSELRVASCSGGFGRQAFWRSPSAEPLPDVTPGSEVPRKKRGDREMRLVAEQIEELSMSTDASRSPVRVRHLEMVICRFRILTMPEQSVKRVIGFGYDTKTSRAPTIIGNL